MSRLFRRALSTFSSVGAAAPGPSSSSTLPQAVRRRRAEHPGAVQPSPVTDPAYFASGENLLPPKLEDQFQILRARGEYPGNEPAARAAFLQANQAWRSRVRGGHGRANLDGKTITDTKLEFLGREGAPRPPSSTNEWRDSVVGQKIYLPNIQIRLMRNHTPEGEAYDPFVATFRIPNSMNKPDLRSYLLAVYGLEVTYIRTDNYNGELTRARDGRIVRKGGAGHNYKRAVVGLKEPFHYPDDIEEMRAGTYGGAEAGEKQAAEREAVLDKEYAIKATKQYRDGIRFKMYKGWRWRSGTHDNAGNTIREIMRRRTEREAQLEEFAQPYAPEVASAETQEAPKPQSA